MVVVPQPLTLSPLVGEVSRLDNLPVVARALNPLVLQNYGLVESILSPPVSSDLTVLSQCFLHMWSGVQDTDTSSKWYLCYLLWFVAMLVSFFILPVTTWKAETKGGTEAVDEADDEDDEDEDEETHAGPEEPGRPASLPPVVAQGGTVG